MGNLSDIFATRQSGQGARQYLYYPASGIYTAHSDQDIIIDAIGGGGSGACVMSLAGGATGAGAGGRARKRVSLKAGDALTISIGAGGAGVTPKQGGRFAGSHGGDTTVTGAGINMMAGGGKGGNAGDYIQTLLAGGLGGIASGGDQDFSGGRGGNIVAVDKISYRATGGGAVNLGLGAFHGGDILVSLIDGPNNVQASGGAGIGQSGVSIVSGAQVQTDGGGVGPFSPLSPFVAFIVADRPLLGFAATLGPATMAFNQTLNNISGPGGGTGGAVIRIGYYGGRASSQSGYFAGSGGAANSSDTQCFSGACGFGGGSGGVDSASVFGINGAADIHSAAGGGGLVVLEILS